MVCLFFAPLLLETALKKSLYTDNNTQLNAVILTQQIESNIAAII